MPETGTGGPRPERVRGRKRARTAIFVTVLLDLLGFGMILPILPFYGQQYGASDLQVGVLFASFSAAQLVFAPVLGRLSDRVGRRPVLLVTIAASASAHLVFAFAGSFAVLVAARVASGAAAANFGIAQAYMADVSARGERAKAMGLVGAAFGLGFVLGPAFGGLLSLVDRVAVPLGAAGLGIVNLALASAWLPESLPPDVRAASRAAPWLDLRRAAAVVHDGTLFGLMLLLFTVTFCMSMMEATVALLVQARFGWGDAETAWLFVFVGVVMVAAQGGLIGVAVARWGERRVIPAGIAAIAGGLGLLAVAASPPAVYLAAALLAAGAGLNAPATLGLLSRLAGEASQGGTLGVARSFGALARVLGPLAGTWLFGRSSPAAPYWSGAAILVAALALAWLLLRRVPADGPAVEVDAADTIETARPV